MSTSTSREAKNSLSGTVLLSMRGRVLHAVRSMGRHGATCEEVEGILRMPHQTASARIRDLAKDGAIYDTGARRPTRSGRKARVYRLCPAARP